MPNPNTVPVNVVVNFNNITYDTATNQWTVPAGTPVWTVPAKTPVPAGDNVIQWTLRAVQGTLPSGFAASFASGDGIEFGSDWQGGTPNRADATTYTVTDVFTQPPQDEDYEYGINVVLTSTTDSSISKTFPYDPEVENEGANLTHVSAESVQPV